MKIKINKNKKKEQKRKEKRKEKRRRKLEISFFLEDAVYAHNMAYDGKKNILEHTEIQVHLRQ